MQTIYVTVKQVPGNGFALQIGNKVIGSVYNDARNAGRYVALFAHGTPQGRIKDGMRYLEAVEFITDVTERHFAEFCLNVEFN